MSMWSQVIEPWLLGMVRGGRLVISSKDVGEAVLGKCDLTE